MDIDHGFLALDVIDRLDTDCGVGGHHPRGTTLALEELQRATTQVGESSSSS